MANVNWGASRVVATLLGVVLMGSGVSKLAGAPQQVASFLMWGLPAWFRMLVGTFEMIGGLLLIAPATAPVGSLILSTIMIGALWTHLVHREWLHTVPALGVLTLLLWVFGRTREHAIRLLGGV